jgi:hypothetical protein
MTSAGTSRLAVVQVAAPAEAAVSVTEGQSLLALPLIRKLTVPVGATGAIDPAGPTCAVKVTATPAATEGVVVDTVNVEVTLDSFWVNVPAAAVVKFVSLP